MKSAASRPWQQENAPVLSTQVPYLWRSSIPSNWVRIKGKQHFLQVTKSPDKPLNYQAAQHQDSLTHTSRRELKAVTKPSLRGSETERNLQLLALQALPFSGKETTYRRLPNNVVQKLHKSLSKPRTQPKPPCVQVLTLALSSSPSTAHYLVNQYARPKALVPPVRLLASAEDGELREGTVDAFLARFEKARMPDLPPKTRRGVNGWKLSMVKPQRSQEIRAGLTERKAESDWREEPYLRTIGLSHEV